MKEKMVLLLLLFSCTGIHAQRIDSLLEQYADKVPQEKIHIHFDNSLYTPGQTVFYKAYLMNGSEVSELSKNIYVDWFDESGKNISRNISPVVGSCAIGSFTVPAKYSGSRLQVLAYTKWMLNFDSAFLFHHTISIAQTVLQNSTNTVVPVTTLQFFPEGGDLVENISSPVAFKAINTAGDPVDVQGNIVNSKNETVISFTPDHAGMGKFSFTPAAGETYTATWTDPQGNNRTTVLPVAKRSGIVLSVNTAMPEKLLSIERNPVLEDRFRKVTIVGTMNQQMVFRATASLVDKNKITATLPVDRFGSGVLLLTVFDNTLQPVAERVLFVNNGEYRFPAQIITDTLNLEKRGKNVYSVEIKDTLPVTLSLSITDGDSPLDSAGNIISQFLLSSEIRGSIKNPAYYFSGKQEAAQQLDLVMLTNGWRRFVWDDVLTGKTPVLKYEKDTGYLSISGKVAKLSDKKIKKAEMMNLVLMAKDSSRQFIFAELKPDGSFRQDNMILFDTTKVFYQLNKTNTPGKNRISINNTFLAVDTSQRFRSVFTYLPDTTGMARIKAIAAEQKRLEELMKQTTLKEVIVRAKVKTKLQEMEDRYAEGLFKTNRSHDFDIVDDPIAASKPSVFAYLQVSVAGLQIDDAYGLNPRATRRHLPVQLFLDETPIDASMLATVSMANVAYVKVIDPPFFGAFGGGGGGAIAVYTRRGEDRAAMFAGLDYTLIPGYAPVKEFYMPNHAEQVNFNQPDLRRTIFWKPDIQLDGDNKKAMISFYNNDISHTLQLVLEGVAADGRLIHISRLLR